MPDVFLNKLKQKIGEPDKYHPDQMIQNKLAGEYLSFVTENMGMNYNILVVKLKIFYRCS